MASELAKHVDTLAVALLAIRDVFSDPSAVMFNDVAADMEKLEGALHAKALIDAAFAHICERDRAGRFVGAKHPDAYLKERLGLSPREARERIARGRDLFSEPPIPEPGDTGEDVRSGAKGETPAEAAARRATEEEVARERARREQERARKQADKINAEKQAAIRYELDKLLDAARGARPRLLAAALRDAQSRDLKDLRVRVRRWVDDENRKHAEPANPNAGMERRGVRIGRRNADGTHDITITAPAGDAALLKALLDKGSAPNSNLPDGMQDYRSPSQRHYDQLMKVLRHFDTCNRPVSGGCASVVISVTLDEIAGADAATLFATNTGIELDVFDLVRLGMDGTDDFVLAVDGATGVPLNLLRTNRTASIAQRVALLAVQGVCAWSGCTAPITECEAHHIVAWIQGGNTDISNLTALCREHHRCNNDHRDHRFNTRHMELDPKTGRVGLKLPGEPTLRFNQADAAERSAVNRIRARGKSSPAHRLRPASRQSEPDVHKRPPPARSPGPPF
ncbi:HNH endonuclease [Corynebacterium qintianiae]|uniref:HNH endonuclease n=1 Tax=Corynebacterium qintianiae TaxID=2709392 RepID=A0A7T0KKP3_9CORY|nr:HNH endonuclease [Corynebacterium qintianiae]QPK82387.1 HNH endonuclease [Corynebacterium qintianiae]